MKLAASSVQEPDEQVGMEKRNANVFVAVQSDK